MKILFPFDHYTSLRSTQRLNRKISLKISLQNRFENDFHTQNEFTSYFFYGKISHCIKFRLLFYLLEYFVIILCHNIACEVLNCVLKFLDTHQSKKQQSQVDTWHIFILMSNDEILYCIHLHF